MSGRRGGVAALALFLALSAIAGCGGPTTADESAAALTRALAGALPEGWRAGTASTCGFAVPDAAGDDVVIWRAEAVPMRRGAAGVPPHFALLRRERIDPAGFAALHAADAELRARHAALARGVATMPRDSSGSLMPRGEAEQVQAATYQREVAALPPLPPALPTHRYGLLGLLLRDTRAGLVPTAREHQQEMNRAYVAITGLLEPYRP